MRRHTVFKELELKTMAGVASNTLSEDLYSEELETKCIDVCGLILDISAAAALNAAMVVQVKTLNSSWSDIDFGAAISLSANGNLNIKMETPPFEKIRIKFVWTAGTANVVLNFSGKSIGA